MRTLPNKLRKNGFDYTLVLRGKLSYIYEQRVTETISYFEAFRIKTKPERKIGNNVFPASEVFPHNEAFGYWAWTYRSYENAKRKFDILEHLSGNTEITP